MVNIISRELHAFQQMTHLHLKYEFMAVVLKKKHTTVQKFGVSKIFFSRIEYLFQQEYIKWLKSNGKDNVTKDRQK